MSETDINSKAKKAGAWYTISNILLKGCVFLTLPIFTRILSTSDFGIYNSYIAIEGIFTAIVGLGLYSTVKNAKLDFKENFDKYLSSILSASVLMLVFVLALVNSVFIFTDNIFGYNQLICNCLVIQSYGSFLLFFYGSKLNIEFKYKSYVLLTAFNTIFNILCSILLILFVFPNERYYGRIIGSAIPLIIIGICVSVYIFKKGKTLFNKKYWKYGLMMGIPLVPHVISQSLLSQFDRVMIQGYCDSSKSGIYSYIYTLCTITYVIASSLDNAWTPWVYMKLKDHKEEEIKEKSKDYIKLFLICTIGFICIIPEVMMLFADQEYWGGMDLLIPLSVANFFIFLYLLPVGIEYYNKKTGIISVGTILATILNCVLNIIFIRLFDYKAAAYTTLFSYFALFILHCVFAKKYGFYKAYNIKNIIKYILMLIGVSVIVQGSLYINQYVSIIVRYVIVFVILLYMVKNRKLIISVFKKGK